MDDAARRHQHLDGVTRLVVKIGSAVIAPDGVPSEEAFHSLARQFAAIRARGISLAVVSSGAVASGFRPLGFDRPPATVALKQAAAAVGQPLLMQAWSRALGVHGVTAAQVLFTAEDLGDRARYLNARRTMAELIDRGVLPIINENDTVSYEEIRFGDNDMLSALAADVLSADALIILSKATGLYEHGDPSRVIPTVATDPSRGDDVATHVRDERSSVGTGGMASKLAASMMSARWGIPTIVAGGHVPEVLTSVLSGEVVGTLFAPSGERMAARHRWLTGAARPKASIRIDAGATKALRARHASLLPSGVTGVDGVFDRGAIVVVRGPDGDAVAKGVTLYSSEEITRIAGLRSDQIEASLGYSLADEVVHRDDLALV
ncbi:MAG: glutamate 5-kinase [Phycisphaerae bacterium]